MYWGNTSPFIRATEQKFILIMWLNEAARRKTNQKQMLCLGCWAFLVKWSNIQALSAAYICPQFSPGQQLKPHQSHHAQSFISPAVVCRFSSSSAAVLSFCSSDCLTAENLSHISTFHFDLPFLPSLLEKQGSPNQSLYRTVKTCVLAYRAAGTVCSNKIISES